MGPDFVSKGFLANPSDWIKEELEPMWGPYRKMALELNRFAMQFQYSLNVHNEDGAELAGAVYFSRLVATYQSALLLMDRGLKAQTEMLIRCSLESLFPLCAIAVDPKWVNRLLEDDGYEREKMIGKIKTFRENNNIDLEGIDTLLDRVKAQNLEENNHGVSTWDSASKAGMSEYYDTVYRHTSFAVHSKMRSLQDHMLSDDGKKASALLFEPISKDLDVLYCTLLDCLARAIDALSKIMGLPELNKAEEIRTNIQSLRETK